MPLNISGLFARQFQAGSSGAAVFVPIESFEIFANKLFIERRLRSSGA
jgi:hypothetical protein